MIWTAPALLDLEEIAEYIALDDFEAARKLVQIVFSSVERLSKTPNSGRKPPELHRTSYREVIVGSCRVFYRVELKKVYILYVMRGEHDLRKYLLEERKNRSR